MPSRTLAVDFGTSNSAVALAEDGRIRRIAVEGGADTLPTAVFFPTGGAMTIGAAATRALIEGEEGRYLRALKSILGTPLFHEPRLLGGKRRTLADVVTDFLKALKSRAEAETGERFSSVLSGRPVHFHTNDPARDAQAEADLAGCWRAAGFDDVAFMAEPEAAARAARGLSRAGETGLIVDIGGGTSDFSLYRIAGERIEILASHGIRLGGTDFDSAVSMTHAMPLLGLGGSLKRTFGEGALPVPRGIFVELSTWAKIPFLYTRETERDVRRMAREAEDPVPLERLAAVIEDRLGHALAFAAEEGKIAANSGANDAAVEMGIIERGLRAPITAQSLSAALEAHGAALRQAMVETLEIAGLTAADVDAAVLVGGSSLMGLVEGEVRALLPHARIDRSEAFTAVVDGLALAAAEG